MLQNIDEEIAGDDEEVKQGNSSIYNSTWVEISGISDVDEEDKLDINILHNDV